MSNAVPSSTVKDRFPLSQRKLADFCRRYHVEKLRLFGSILRDDFTAKSDVDVLLNFQNDAKPTFFILSDMMDELSILLNGRQVDIKTPSSLSKYYRDEVLSEAEVMYEQT